MSDVAIDIAEVPNGDDVARDLFQRRFRCEPPACPHHVIAFESSDERCITPLCYIHFTDFQTALLGGGACVDTRAVRHLSANARAEIRSRGGLYRMTLEWAVEHFRERHTAIFGYCGDKLAERVDVAAGFEHTGHPRLLVQWTRDTPSEQRDRLVAAAHALGPF